MASIAVTLLLGAVGLSPHWGSVAAQGPEPQAPQVALGKGFTYQGQLKKNNAPVNDNNCSMTFSLWNSQSNGTGQIGGDQLISPVAVANGLFTVVLNGGTQFGAGAFAGQERWLQTAVQCAGDGSPVTLSRQQLTAAPYALFASAPWVTSASDLHYTAGNVGLGTTTPAHHLSIFGGPLWTSNSWSGAMDFSNNSALGWQANAGGARFGLGQDNAGLHFFRTGSDPGTTASPAVYDMLITNGGNVGIGTTNPTPADRLSVVGRANFSGAVGIGTTSALATLNVVGPDTSFSTRALWVQNSNGSSSLVVWDNGAVQIGGLFDGSTTHACLKLNIFAVCTSAAEYVPTIAGNTGYPETAELVSLAPAVSNPYGDTHGPFVVQKSVTPCDTNLLGFIVNPGSGADGKKLNEHYLPLAIYGYFPAKVTLENGAIKRGDPLTSSSKPGYGMKATHACKIIGYALEDAEQEGTIQVFANHGENAAPEVAALRAQVKTQAEQLSAQQKQIDALVMRLTALEHSAQSGGVSTLASK